MGAMLEAIKSKTFYEVLNLERDASTDQIKDSYKEIAKLYHPDSNFYTEIIQDPLSAEEEEVFKFITLAYTTLSNGEKRKEYDKTLAPLLKGWEEEAREEDLPKKKTVEKPAGPPPKVPVVTRSPGSIDLGRFQQTIKTRTEQVQQPQPHHKPNGLQQKTVVLVGVLAIATGLCAGLAIILFLR